MKLTICDDGYVAEIKSDEDLELFLEMMQAHPSDYVIDYCYINHEECGAPIFIEASSREEADRILRKEFPENFQDWEFEDEYTPEEAEDIGYDTY